MNNERNVFPYWQFHNANWLTGKISSFDLKAQGLFLHLCMTAWSSKGEFTISPEMVAMRFREPVEWVKTTLDTMTSAGCGILLRSGETYRIKFIDDQLAGVRAIIQKRVEAGKRSAEKRSKKPRAKTHMSSKCSTSVEHVLNKCSTCVELDAMEGFKDAWSRYEAYRKSVVKIALTEDATKAIQVELAKRPQDAVQALAEAQAAGWRGFRWEWYDRRVGGAGNGLPEPSRQEGPAALKARIDAAKAEIEKMGDRKEWREEQKVRAKVLWDRIATWKKQIVGG